MDVFEDAVETVDQKGPWTHRINLRHPAFAQVTNGDLPAALTELEALRAAIRMIGLDPGKVVRVVRAENASFWWATTLLSLRPDEEALAAGGLSDAGVRACVEAYNGLRLG